MVEIELFPLFSLNKPSRLEKMDMGQSIIDTFSVLKDKVSGGYVSAIERYFQSLLGEGNTCKQFFPIHPSFASVRCAKLALATAPFHCYYEISFGIWKNGRLGNQRQLKEIQ